MNQRIWQNRSRRVLMSDQRFLIIETLTRDGMGEPSWIALEEDCAGDREAVLCLCIQDLVETILKLKPPESKTVA